MKEGRHKIKNKSSLLCSIFFLKIVYLYSSTIPYGKNKKKHFPGMGPIYRGVHFSYCYCVDVGIFETVMHVAFVM